VGEQPGQDQGEEQRGKWTRMNMTRRHNIGKKIGKTRYENSESGLPADSYGEELIGRGSHTINSEWRCDRKIISGTFVPLLLC